MAVPERKRRKRLTLSCDRCRKTKRKCDREKPCAACILSKAACTWHGNVDISTSREQHGYNRVASSSKSAETSQDSSPSALRSLERSMTSLSASVPMHSLESHNAAAHSSISHAGSSNNEELRAVLELPGLANVVLTIWFRELDYMYDVVGDTDFEREWRRSTDGVFDGGVSSYRFGPLLLAICAIVCQLHSTDLEAAILVQGGEYVEASWLGQRCWEEAGNRIEREYAMDKKGAHPPLEHFQASLVRNAYLKNTGDRNAYRDLIFRDISRLQRRGLHRQGHYASQADEALANRIFWAYFMYDRFYFMLDGLPYCIGSQHADLWLQDSRGDRIHIQDLCHGFIDHGMANNAAVAPHMSMSIFAASNVKLSALVGRYTDCLHTLKNILGEDTSMLPEEIASQAGQELSILEQQIQQGLYDNTPHLQGASVRVKTLQPIQQYILSMTVAKIKNKIASQLISEMSKASLLSPTLHFQKVDLASKLLQLALSVAAKIPLRQMGWGFFLFYTYEPIIELLDWLYQSEYFMTSSSEQLSFVLSGRNLLVMTSREIRTKIAQDLAKHVCEYSADTLSKYADMDRGLIDAAKDMNTIVKVQKTVDAWSKCISKDCLKQTLENAFEAENQIAEDRSNSAMLQALQDLLAQMANPVLT